MPIKKVKGGYKWGESGKVYPTKAQAAKQARAAYASGYKGYQSGGSVWVTEEEEPSAAVQKIREREKEWRRQLLANIMKMDPTTNIIGAGIFDPNFGGGKGIAREFLRREAIKKMAQKYGPIVSLIGNQGGLLGYGTSGIGGLGLDKAFKKNPFGAASQIANRVKFAQMFPQIAGIGYLLNRIQPRIEGQRGILGQGLGPQLRNLFARILPIKSFAEKEAENVDMYPDIQPVEVTAQKRTRKPRKPRISEIADMIKQQNMYGGGIGERLAETGGDPSAFMYGLVPGVAQSMNQGLRASNIGKMLAKRAAARALTGKEAKYDRSGLNRKISSGGASRK